MGTCINIIMIGCTQFISGFKIYISNLNIKNWKKNIYI